MENKTNDLWNQAEKYRLRARTALEEKNLSETEQLAQEAVRLFRKCGDDYQYTKALNFLGVVYARMGDECRAMDYYLEGLEYASDRTYYDIQSLIYNNIGSRYQEFGEHKKAIYYFQKALEAYRQGNFEQEADYWNSTFVCSLNLAISYQKLGRPKEAAHCLERAEEAMEKTSVEEFRLAVMVIKSSICWDNGDRGFVKEHLTQLMKLCGELNVVNDYLQNVQELAAVLKKTGQHASWKELLQMVEEVAEKQDIIYYRLISIEMWMDYYHTMGEMEKYGRLCMKHARLSQQQKEVEHRERAKTLDMRIALREKEKERRIAEKKAETDSLTGVGNRYGLEKESRRLVQEAVKEGKVIAVGILDIDFFKQVNDTYGHNVGDECLRQVAGILKKAVDGYGSVYRFGGDEFVILVPEGDYEAAEVIAAQIKNKLKETHIENLSPRIAEKITLSQGYVCFRPSGEERLSVLLERADKALYKVKNSGKNGYRIILEEW